MTRPFQMINSITTDQLRDLIHASVNDMPEWDPSFGLTELQTAYAHAVSPQMVLQLINEVERLGAFYSNQRITAEAWQKSYSEAGQSPDSALARAEYWKQRAKSAEGHLFASDFKAAAVALHKACNYSEIPFDQLTPTQLAHIDHGVAAVVVAINARRAVRRPGDEAEVAHG